MYRALLIILLILYSSNVSSQQHEKRCNELINKAKKAEEANKPDAAIKFYTEAGIIAKEHDLAHQLWVVKNNIGNIYGDISSYGEALRYFSAALNVVETHPELLTEKASTYTNIGNLYNNFKDDNSLKYHQKAYQVALKSGPPFLKKLIALNIAEGYNEAGMLKESEKILLEVKEPVNNKRIDKGWYIIYGHNLFLKGEIAKAKKLTDSLYPDINKLEDGECYVCIVELLAKIYSSQRNIDPAIDFVSKGLEVSKELDDRISLFNQLSDLYLKKNDYKSSSKYKDSVIVLSDSLSRLINHNLYAANKAVMKVKEYQEELDLNNEKYRHEKIVFNIIIIFGSITIIILCIGFRNRILGQKQNKLILENQQHIDVLELESLQGSLAEKNRKLSAKALYLSGRNQLISEVIETLSRIPEIINNKELISYIDKLRNHLQTDAEWDEFIANFEEVNPEFLAALKEKHPNLSGNEIRFLCYIYMNISLKEISTILNITYNACRIRKRRIAEKLNLDKEISLYDYVREIK